MRFREKNMVATIPLDLTQPRSVQIPKDGHARWLRAAIAGSFTLSGGSASGSAHTTPPSPIGIAQLLRLTRNGESFAGPLQVGPVPLALFHYAAIPFLRRAPARTPPSSGDAATYSVYAELFFPLSLMDGMDTALPVRGRSSWELEVTFPATVALVRDALYSGNDRTLANSATDPLRLEVTLGDILPDAGDSAPLMEIGFRVDTIALTGTTGRVEKELSVPPGEVPIMSILNVVNNSLRAVVPGAPSNRIEWSFGQTEPVISSRPAELAIKNASDYGVRDGDLLAGAYILDLAKVYGGAGRIPVVAAEGGRPRIAIDSGSTAWTSTSYANVLTIVGRYTDAGLAKLS